MVRVALIAILLSGCSAAPSMVVGATTVTAAAVGAAALQRSSGGCYAICTAGTSCNPRTGLCETMPCEGKCAANEHCETSPTQSWCAPGPASDVVTKAKGSDKVLPVLPAPPPVSGGPPQITPAAEQNPPSHK